jgi:hypothetical protein
MTVLLDDPVDPSIRQRCRVVRDEANHPVREKALPERESV